MGPGSNATVPGTTIKNDNTTSVDITAATQLVGTSSGTSNDLATAITNGSVLTVDGKTITFSTAQTSTTTDGAGNVTIGTGAGSTATVQTVLSAIDGITGATTASTVNGTGQLILSTGTTQNLVIAGTGNVLAALGLGRRNDQRHSPRDHRSDAADRCHRRRHANQHHVRHRRRPGLDPQPAQYGVGGE